MGHPGGTWKGLTQLRMVYKYQVCDQALERRHPSAPQPSLWVLPFHFLKALLWCCSLPATGRFSCWVPSTVLLHPTAQMPNAGGSGASAFAALDPRLSKVTHYIHYQLLKQRVLGMGAAEIKRTPIGHARGGGKRSGVHPAEVPEPLEVQRERTNILVPLQSWIIFFK